MKREDQYRVCLAGKREIVAIELRRNNNVSPPGRPRQGSKPAAFPYPHLDEFWGGLLAIRHNRALTFRVGVRKEEPLMGRVPWTSGPIV